MTAIFKREVRAYFNGLVGYVFGFFLLLFAGIYTVAVCIGQGYPDFEFVLSNMDFIFLVATPLLTMRIIADERRQRTDQLLYSLPIRMSDVVIGKFLAMLVVLAVPLAVLSIYPLVLAQFGTIYLKLAYSCIVAFFFMGAALIAVGMFISALTENQAIAAGLCFVVLLVNYYLTSLAGFVPTTAFASFAALIILALVFGLIVWLLTRNWTASAAITGGLWVVLIALYVISASWFEGLLPAVLEKLSIFEQYTLFVNGVFDLSSLVYFLAVIVIFCYMTVQALEKRRWS